MGQCLIRYIKKGLQTPKGYLEAVNRRYTGNTMIKRKEGNDLKHTTMNTKDLTTRTLLKQEGNSGALEG